MTEVLLERPPESEVYGRSLSTIYRLGSFMVDKSRAEIITSPEAEQARAEFYTSVEEGFGTDMELGGGLEVRDFDTRSVVNGQVMSKDLYTSISAMTEAGLICAEETAQTDERFLPQLTRSKWDHNNALLVDKMARGETGYNTRIVISPFPEEAAAKSGNAYWRDIGYVPHLKRGFVQLYHVTKEGELIAGSLSFDGSNKQRLRKIFAQHGQEIPEDEATDNWLKHAITGTLSEEQAKELAMAIADQAAAPGYRKTTNTVDVTHAYRPFMDRAFDDSYIHICESLARGYQTEKGSQLILQLADKAQYLNARYSSALYRMRTNKEQFTDYDSRVLHELLVYSTIEMMRALHLKNTETHDNQDNPYYYQVLTPSQLQQIDSASFQGMLGGFGAEGARHNRMYSACGLSISLGEENGKTLGNDNEIESPQSAFGGVEGKGSLVDDRYGSRYFKCPKGHTNTRPHNRLIEKCQVCKCDVRCK